MEVDEKTDVVEGRSFFENLLDAAQILRSGHRTVERVGHPLQSMSLRWAYSA